MSERTDATLLPLGGSATTTRVVIVAGVSEIQSLLDAVEAATDALEKDDEEEVVFHNQEDVPLGPGISEQVRRAQCPAKASFAPGPNDVGITDAVTSSDPSPLQLETKVPLAANNGRVDPLVDLPAYLSRNDTPLNLVHSEPQTEPLEVPKPIPHNQGETQSESSAGSPELEVDRDKGKEILFIASLQIGKKRVNCPVMFGSDKVLVFYNNKALGQDLHNKLAHKVL